MEFQIVYVFYGNGSVFWPFFMENGQKNMPFLYFSELRAVNERFFEAFLQERLQNDEIRLHQLVERERQLRRIGIVIGDAAFQRQGETAGAHRRQRV